MPNRKSSAGRRPEAGDSDDHSQRNPFQQLKSLLSLKKAHSSPGLSEDHIRSILAARRARAVVFGADLFSDPAWDILLELYAAHLEGHSFSVRDLAGAIDTPQSTLARWMLSLEQSELIMIENGPAEDDASTVQLTPHAIAAVRGLADHWSSAFLSI